jgi:hypothetical protein
MRIFHLPSFITKKFTGLTDSQLHYNIFVLRQRKKTVAKTGKTVAKRYKNGFQAVLYRGVVLGFRNGFCTKRNA